MRYGNGYRVIPLTPALDWSAWNVQADPVTGANTFVLPAIPAYFAGFRLYAQAAVWDQFSFPVPTTDFRGTDY